MKSSSIIGGAQVVSIAVGLLKMKAVALLLGPVGVGLVGLYLSLIQTGSSVAALGIGTIGTRQIAAAHANSDDIAVGRIRRALFWGTLILAVVGAMVFWLASRWIATIALGDAARASDVAWLSLAVGLTVAAGSQSALLTGLRRVADLARVNVASGALGSGLGVLALWLWGPQGMIAMVLIAPLVTLAIGHVYVSRLGPPIGLPIRISEMSSEWRTMVRLGFAFMLTGLATTLGNLAARALVQRELGPEALGQFQAAWAIGMTYLGFVLGAMGTDYYPRVAAVINDHAAATRLVNEQTEVALLLCAPVLLAMLGLAPWVIHLLYSSKFGPAAEILRWQLLGDVLKVLSWPMGFAMLAAGSGKTLIVTESLATGVFVLVVLILTPLIGVKATGVAFLALYSVHLPMMRVLCGSRIGFRWTRGVKAQAISIAGAALLVDIIARWSTLLGAITGVGLAAATFSWALVRLSSMAGVGGKLGQLAALGQRISGWIAAIR